MSTYRDDVSIITNYFPNLNEDQLTKLSALKNIYLKWNSQINVISRKDMDSFYLHHVLHSLGIAKVIHFKPGTNIMDVGTGGGFPGIPLAILFPETNFYLIDSIGKKIKVVNAVKDELQIKNVYAEQARAETVNREFDFIISRAVTDFQVFYQWVKNKINKKSFNKFQNGLLCLKGGNLQEELNDFEKNLKIYTLQNFFNEDFFETKKIVYYPIELV